MPERIAILVDPDNEFLHQPRVVFGILGNAGEILCELFRGMDLKSQERDAAKIRNWTKDFPYVNGGMFAGGAECPKFSRIARSYLLSVGNLEWDKINPDIFGSMIQA